jgi:isocitrate lyase
MATTHQKFVGTGYFDRVMNAVSEGETSVGALSGSTEEQQF